MDAEVSRDVPPAISGESTVSKLNAAAAALGMEERLDENSDNKAVANLKKLIAAKVKSV